MLPPGGGGGGDSAPAAPAATELEDLPSELLAGLPASDVVRTSVLSQTWRTRWESIPNLAIDLDGARVRDWDSAARFLDRCASPVGGLTVAAVPLRLRRRIDGWVRAVAGKSPRALSLSLPMPVPLPSLFACSELTELKLMSVVVPPPPPGFLGFRALTELDLDFVVFPGQRGWERLEAMIAAAGATLERLRLENIVFLRDVSDGGGLAATVPPADWVIRAPNVRRLELCLTMAAAGGWELAHFPKLEYALITFSERREPRDYGRLLAAVSNARELDIRNYDRATHLVDGFTIMLHVSCAFENLRTLKLHTHFHEVSTILSTFSLLCQAPHLQVLEITESSRHEINKEADAFAENFVRTTLANIGLVKNLECLRMKSVSCSPCDMQFIKLVLRNARNLQMASVEMFKGHWNSAFDASRMIKQFKRASPAAMICFQHGGYCWLV